jgi:hypothetical protein
MKRSMATLVALAVLAPPAAAQVLFNTMGPGNSYSPQTYYAVWPTVAPRLGWAFTAQGTGPVGVITAPIFRATGTASASFELYADAGEGLPGSLLGSWTVVPPSTNSSPLGPVTVLPVAGGPVLQQGSLYYFVVGAPPGGSINWQVPPNFSSVPVGAQVWVDPGSGQWMTEPQRYAAFSLVVPGPGAAALLGAAGVVAARRRRA